MSFSLLLLPGPWAPLPTGTPIGRGDTHTPDAGRALCAAVRVVSPGFAARPDRGACSSVMLHTSPPRPSRASRRRGCCDPRAGRGSPGHLDAELPPRVSTTLQFLLVTRH